MQLDLDNLNLNFCQTQVKTKLAQNIQICLSL